MGDLFYLIYHLVVFTYALSVNKLYFYLMKKCILLLCSIVCLLCACNSDTKPETNNQASNDLGLSKLIKQNPDDPSLLIDRSAVYAKEGAYRAAIDDVQQAMNLDSNNVSYYHILSNYYMDYLKSREAIEILNKANEKFPDDITTLLKLSENHLILKNYEQSMLAANKVLNIDPQHPEGFFMLGMNFRDAGDTNRAINSFQEATEIEPDLYDAWIILGQLYEDLGKDIALKYYESAIEIDPKNVNGWHSKAFYLQNNNQVDEALEIYRQINLIDKQFPQAYLNAGILYLEKDSLEQAYDQFNILVNTNPINYYGFYYRGITNELMNRIDLAKEDYETCLRIQPAFTKAQAALNALNS